ncbi:hypothetical protein B0H13DRAFT_2342679 [Mycena leptocephala]|nr:hypothetical protein B0H13DRAFT_2342679 [Mycena leptocephala]
MLPPRPHTRPPCSPALFTPGNIDLNAHSQRAALKFYIVFEGHLRGIFTEEHEAHLRVNGVSNGTWQKAKTWDDALAIWDELCARHHGDGCPVVEIPSPPDSPPRRRAPSTPTLPCAAATPPSSTSSARPPSNDAPFTYRDQHIEPYQRNDPNDFSLDARPPCT